MASKTKYWIEVRDADTQLERATATVESTMLAKIPPVGQPFLGAMFGLYAFGNWEPCLDPAYFQDISCYTGYSKLSKLY